MNEKVMKPILLAGAAALCLWGIYSVLNRQPNTPAAAAKEEIPAAEWQLLLPAGPAEGITPTHSGIPTGAPLSEAGFIRSAALPDGSTLRLALSGGAYQAGLDGTRYVLASIAVQRDGKGVQTISFDEPYFQRGVTANALETARPDFGFTAGDFNFDGSIDFSVATCLSQADGAFDADYAFHFLWSPERGYFVPAPELDALPSPEFDEESQTVSCVYTGHERYGWEHYGYMGGLLYGIEKWEQRLDRESWVLSRTAFGWGLNGWEETGRTEEPAKKEVSRTVQLAQGEQRISLTLSGTVFRQGPGPEETAFRGCLSQIEIRREDGSQQGALIQVLSLDPSGVASDLERNNFNTEIIDLDSDGFFDLRIRGWNAEGAFYRCFLWDTGTGQFVEGLCPSSP